MVPGKAPVKSCFFAFLKLLETLRELFLAYTICCCHQHSSLWWLLSSCMKVIISKLKQRGVSLHPGCCSLGSGTCLNSVMTLQSPPSPHPIRFWETVTAWEFPKSFLCCNRPSYFNLLYVFMADQGLSTGQLIFISKYISICDQRFCVGLFGCWWDLFVFNSVLSTE